MPHDTLIIHTDGASRGNPGAAAIGIIFYDENRKELKRHAERIGKATNNEAEYTAIIRALELARAYKCNNIQVFCDSEFAVKQITGRYKIKDDRMRRLFTQVKEKEALYGSVTYTHVPREQNDAADAMANAALDGLI